MAIVTSAALAALDSLASEQGWAYASSPSIDATDPGRYHCLFGRDSLITALQALPLRPEMAAATLRTLAAQQGTIDDPETDEQPGRIVHEYREVAPQYMIDLGWPVREGKIAYYGSSDSVGWFLHLLAATGDTALQQELEPNWRAAGAWLERALTTGRGFVRCGPREHSGGLLHQGWRDAQDPQTDAHGGGIIGPDGNAPASPLADADSQAAALAGLDALATLDAERAASWRDQAAALRQRISDIFTPDAMAIDGHDAVVPGAGSQLGWLLWSQALSPAAAQAAAERLTRPDVLTPFGARTLSSQHPHFSPQAYHRGAIWPFDNWFVWGGLQTVGHPAADSVRDGVRQALSRLGHYPELYTVTMDGDLVGSAISNRIQAWTVGACVAFDADWTGRPQSPAVALT